MFCKHCGKQIDDTANACPHCGTGVTRKVSDTNPTGGVYNSRVPETVHQDPDTQMTVQMSKPYKAPDSKKKISPVKIIIAIVALVLVAAIVAGTFFFLEKKKEEEAAAHREKLTQLLEEKTTKPVIEMFFEDYDNNGSIEAFALVGEKSKGDGEDVEYTDADLYFVNEKKVQLIEEKITGQSNGILTAKNEIKYISLENVKSDSSHSYIYGVKSNAPFESATSGTYYEVHQDGDRIVGKKDPKGGFIEITVSNETLVLSSDYEDVIDQYKEVIKNRLDFDESKDNFGEYVSPLMVNHLSYARNYGGSDSETLYRIYYSVFDMNNDGTEECVIGMGEDINSITIYEMFSYDRKQPVPLFEIGYLGERTNLTLFENGNLYVEGSNGASSLGYEYYTIPKNSSALQKTASFTCEDYQYYKINADGEKEEINDEEFHMYQADNGGAELKIEWKEIRYNNEDPTIIPEPQVGDVIEFGTYPQSRVTDANTISQLNNSASYWQSYSYYSATDYEGGEAAPGDFMKYCDVTYNGEKYRGVTFSQYRPYYTTAYATAEYSFQDENGYSTNTVYWFKYEPIKWRILDSDTGLVMCEDLIDTQPFSNTVFMSSDDAHLDVESRKYWSTANYSDYANDYSVSSIRKWLNNDFYNVAFDSEMKSEILSTTLSNVNPQDSSHYYADAYDKVFLLSVEEITNPDYGFSSDLKEKDKMRESAGTDYAMCQGLNGNPSSAKAFYWLRSPHSYLRQVWITTQYGLCTCGDEEHVDEADIGVRPAMRLSDLTIL